MVGSTHETAHAPSLGPPLALAGAFPCPAQVDWPQASGQWRVASPQGGHGGQVKDCAQQFLVLLCDPRGPSGLRLASVTSPLTTRSQLNRHTEHSHGHSSRARGWVCV